VWCDPDFHHLHDIHEAGSAFWSLFNFVGGYEVFVRWKERGRAVE
jgi:hypothetical protein